MTRSSSRLQRTRLASPSPSPRPDTKQSSRLRAAAIKLAVAVAIALAPLATGIGGIGGVAGVAGIAGPGGNTAPGGNTGIAAPGSATPAAADVNDFMFSEFAAEYELGRDSQRRATLTTKETFVAQFPDYPQNRGIIRYIPLDYNGVELDTTLLGVRDEQGTPIPYDTSEENGLLAVSIGTDEYLLGEHRFMITYEQTNVVRDFANTNANEWYWDTNGTGWAQRFDRVSAQLRVSKELVPSLTGNAACYQGPEGSTERCTIKQRPDDPGLFNATAKGSLDSRENMTLAVGFERGTFDVPVAPRNQWWNSVLPFVFLALGAVALIMLGIARARLWKAPVGRGIVVPQYEVPPGVNLLEAHALIGAYTEALPAQLVSFAVRKNIRIVDQSSVDGSAGSDFALVFRTADGLDPLERQFITALFGNDPAPGTSVDLDGPDADRASSVHSVMSQAKTNIRERGWKGQPESALPWQWMLASWSFALATLVSVFAVYAMQTDSELTVLAAIGGVGLCCIAIGIAWRPTWLTSSGIELFEYLQGLRMYLELAEKDRFAMLQSVPGAERVVVDVPMPGAVPAEVRDPGPPAAGTPVPGAAHASSPKAIVHIYEQLLPFAVLWGLERSWTEALAVYYAAAEEKPDWLQTPAGAGQIDLFPSLTSFSNSVSLATSKPAPPPGSGSSSSWSSGGGSFSGGSTGGGFSGGGGGGGGGGGR